MKACPRPGKTLGSINADDDAKRLKAVVRVATKLSKELTKKHVSHAIIGGLAVRAHGYRRFTYDVDLLVLDPAAFEGSPLAVVPGVSFERDGVGVEAIYPTEDEDFLEEAVALANPTEDGTPIIGIEALIFLKMKAGRTKDTADIVELIRRSPQMNTKVVGRYLRKHAPHLAEDWPGLVALAKAQKDAGPQ